MDDLLKEAIADAKAVRETALANAKMALEEAFTPRLKSMLAKKIQSEIEDEDEDAVEEQELEDEDDVVDPANSEEGGPVSEEDEMSDEDEEETATEGEEHSDEDEDEVENLKGSKCYYPYYKMFVDWNGDVLFCSNDWGREIIIGNLLKQSLYDVWMSDKMKEIRDRLSKGDRSSSPCNKCSVGGTLFGQPSFDLINEYYESSDNGTH